MTTPVLTKKQQRHSLSAKKGPAKGLRNVLAQPNLNFWPAIKVNQYPELVTNLKTILPSIKQTNNKIPKHMLKTVSKEDRALARREMLKTAPPKPDILKFMIMGINVVTRALEKDNVCCVLLDANVEPPLIIKHIVIMAANKKIPVLLLPILKTITLEKMGFATAAFALKQEVKQCPDNVCYPLYKSIAETFENFETPECLLRRFESDEVSDKSAICEAKTGMDCSTNPNISKPEKPVTVFTDVYKYRSSRDKRAFIPPTVNKSSQVSQTLSDDFIALGSDLDSASDKSSKTTVKNKSYINISKKGKRTEKSEDIEETQCFKKLKLVDNNADFIALGSDFDPVNDKSFTIKNKRYVDIGKEEKHTKESENIGKNQSFNKLKLIDNTDSIKQTKNYILKRHASDELNYLSLKLKRVQGNAKRKKATKLAKKKR